MKIITIRGPQGSGKTLVANAIVGAMRQVGHQVHLNDGDCSYARAIADAIKSGQVHVLVITFQEDVRAFGIDTEEV